MGRGIIEGGKNGEDDEKAECEEEEEEWGEERDGFGKERKSAREGYKQMRKVAEHSKLEAHQVFRQARLNAAVVQTGGSEGWRPRIALNLIAYDGLGRLFVWDSEQKRLHFVEIQRSDSLDAFKSDTRTLLASRNFQTVQLSSPVDFQVLHLAFNRTGRSLVLAGDGALMVLNLLAPSGTTCSGLCRVQKVGAERIFSKGDGHWLRILQIGWHPYSDTHLGVLSSDGCFRLFDLSLDAESAEQEYYLQPTSSGRTRSAALVRAIAFAYGGEHLWDRFTVFVLYNDGSVFSLCPIVPFSSMFNGAGIDELSKDARQLELLVGLPHAMAENACLALVWLDAVFPGLATFAKSPHGELSGGSFLLQAHAYVPLDASIVLQGPLATLRRHVVGDQGSGFLEDTNGAAGQAVGLLYSVVGKDSVLAVSTKDGQVQVYVLADEVQPNWNVGKRAQLTVDDKGRILAVGMLVEASIAGASSVMRHKDEVEDCSSTIWPDRIPPLLQLAVVDLALQPTVVETGPMVMFVDPVVPERIYCQHAAGLDAILLQWLPFSAQSANKASADAPPPVVFPILDICPTGFTTPRPLLGVAIILDSLGESWVVAVTANCECAVVNIKPHRALLEPLFLDGDSPEELNAGTVEVGVFQMMSKELLLGPKDIPITQLTSSGAPLTLETIEGRTFLHDQCKLLREKYIEYAHRVHVELTSHGSRLHDIVQEQQRLVTQAEEKLSQAQKGSSALVNRIQQAVLRNRNLEQRVKLCCRLPGVSEKPLTLSEKELKVQLDTMRLQDLDILNSAVGVLSVRSERFSGAQIEQSQRSSPYRVAIPDSQMRRLKQAVEHLGVILEESSMKVKVIDESVSQRELLKDR